MADSNPEDLLALPFAALGLSDKALKEATRNKKIAAAWADLLQEAGIDGSSTAPPPTDANAKIGSALAALVAATVKIGGDGTLSGKRAYVVRAILDGRIRSAAQVDAAVKFAKSAKGDIIDDSVFDSECGVGMPSPPLLLPTDLPTDRCNLQQESSLHPKP